MIIGWYYLHENGSLIYKPETGETAADLRDSDLVKAMWPMEPSQREGAWQIVVESLAMGANPSRVNELADKWQCNDEDAENYASRVGVKLEKDGVAWCATGPGFTNLQESPAGFGGTKLEAMAALAKAVGVRHGKIWNPSFAERLSRLVRAERLETA